MRTGFVILAHAHLHRAAELARHLAGKGAPVMVHLDRRAVSREDFGPAGVISAHAAEWGMMGLVEATLEAAARLLAEHPELRHVFLASGSCLPVRPVGELDAFLEENAATDFIESVPVSEADWVQGGLSEERFTLWFPLAWKRRRRAFDALVQAQRRLRIRRRLPEGIVPHLGSQWWCLSAQTLRAILDNPRLPAWRRFFRSSWIPDESFFQSLVRTLGDSDRLVPKSLTLARFDPTGRPYVFHDDHADWLAGCDLFFARKADPDAGGLYARFLASPRSARTPTEFTGSIDEAPFTSARSARLSEPAGLQTQSRYPSGSGPRLLATARDWAAICGRDPRLLQGIAATLRRQMPDADIHGRLFAPEGAEFADNGGPGNLPADAALRDYRPEQFLARLIFSRRERHTAFLFRPGDTPRVGQMAVRDANARVVLVDDGDADGTLRELRHLPPAPVHASVTRIDAAGLRAEADVPGPAFARLVAILEGRA